MKKNRFYLLTAVALGWILVGTLLWSLARVGAAEPDFPFEDQRDRLQAGVRWLVETHQNDDGGYTEFSSGANLAPSGVGGTLDALLAIAGAGYNPTAVYPGKTAAPISYLQSQPTAVASYAAANGAQAGKLLLALSAASDDPRAFGGHNFVISLTQQLSPTGQYHVGDTFKQSLAILGLTAVDEPVSPLATHWLQSQQAADGSWDDGFGTSRNPDATALAIMALVASGTPISDTMLLNARQFLAEAQLPSGGWEYGPGFGESPSSTALVVQALSALGEPFAGLGTIWDKGGHTPLHALQSWQNSNGAFQVDFGSGRFDDFLTTVQAVPALTGKPYPLPARLVAAQRALGCLQTLQDPASGGWKQFADFPSFPAEVNAAGTARAIQAIAAVGDNPQSARWTTISGTNAVQALENLTPAYLTEGRGGRVGIVMQGVVAAGAPYTVANFAGRDLVLTVSGYLSPTGEYDLTAFGPVAHAEAMLGLLDAGEPVAPTAVAFLQHSAVDGSWGGADSSGIALNVLGRLGLAAPSGALRQLKASQQPDGGWGFGLPSDPSSSSEVVQGLGAQGINPFDPAWSLVVNGRLTNVADTILAQQQANGCWPNPYGSGDDPFGTTDAILLLVQQPGWTRYQTYLPLVK